MSFIVTYPTLIGLVAGSDRLKNYLIQVKDDLFLIDFHSTEMSFIDIKPAFSSYVFFFFLGGFCNEKKFLLQGRHACATLGACGRVPAARCG